MSSSVGETITILINNVPIPLYCVTYSRSGVTSFHNIPSLIRETVENLLRDVASDLAKIQIQGVPLPVIIYLGEASTLVAIPNIGRLFSYSDIKDMYDIYYILNSYTFNQARRIFPIKNIDVGRVYGYRDIIFMPECYYNVILSKVLSLRPLTEIEELLSPSSNYVYCSPLYDAEGNIIGLGIETYSPHNIIWWIDQRLVRGLCRINTIYVPLLVSRGRVLLPIVELSFYPTASRLITLLREVRKLLPIFSEASGDLLNLSLSPMTIEEVRNLFNSGGKISNIIVLPLTRELSRVEKLVNSVSSCLEKSFIREVKDIMRWLLNHLDFLKREVQFSTSTLTEEDIANMLEDEARKVMRWLEDALKRGNIELTGQYVINVDSLLGHAPAIFYKVLKECENYLPIFALGIKLEGVGHVGQVKSTISVKPHSILLPSIVIVPRRVLEEHGNDLEYVLLNRVF